jgi:hypothetical protein
MAARLPPGVAQRSPGEAFTPERLGSLYKAPPPAESAGPPVIGTSSGLTAEQAYLLDTSGFVVLHDLLSAAQLAAAAAAPDEWAAEGAAVSGCLTELLGEGWRLDIAPGVLPQLAEGDPEAKQLVGGSCTDDGRRLRYWDHHGPRRCLGLRVVLALADQPAGAGGLTLLPASHKSTVPTPPSVLTAPEASLAGSLLEQPVLRAGDVLLLAGSLARGLWPWRGAGSQRLLSATFASGRAYPAAGYSVPDPPPELSWLAELTDEQRAVCQARFTGVGGGDHGRGPEIALPVAHEGCDPEEQWFCEFVHVLPAVPHSNRHIALNLDLTPTSPRCAQPPSLSCSQQLVLSCSVYSDYSTSSF